MKTPRSVLFVGSLIMFFGLMVVCPGFAQVPRTMNYQGSLNQAADGNPVNGSVSMTFKLYDALTGGNELWSETHSAVTVDEGIYSVILGTVTPLDTLAFDQPYYLELTIGGEVLTPRQPLTSVPYALQAANLDYIKVDGTIPTVTIDGRLYVSLDNGSLYSSVTVFESKNQEPPYVSWNHSRTGETPSRYGYIKVGDFGDGKRFLFATDNDAKFAFMGNNVGIGTIDPASKLQVTGGTDAAASGGGFLISGDLTGSNIGIDNNEIMARYNGATSPLYLQAEGGDLSVHYWVTGTEFMIKHDGNVGIGTTNPQYKLDVVGTIRGDNVSPSDRRWKEEIAPFGDALERVTQLRGVTFRWNDPSRGAGPQIGVIAQEVEQVFPEVVSTDSEGYKSVAYDRLVAPLIEAVKELKAENDALRAENSRMKEEFERRITALESVMNSQ